MAKNKNRNVSNRPGVIESTRRPGEALATAPDVTENIVDDSDDGDDADALHAGEFANSVALASVDEKPTAEVQQAPIPAAKLTAPPVAKGPTYVATTLPAQNMLKHLEAHKALVVKSRTITPSGATSAAKELLQATRILIANATDEVMQVMWDWHVNNKDGSMSDMQAMMGSKAWDNRDFSLVSTVWGAYRHLVLRDGIPFDLDRIRLITKQQRLVTFLTIKQQQIRR